MYKNGEKKKEDKSNENGRPVKPFSGNLNRKKLLSKYCVYEKCHIMLSLFLKGCKQSVPHLYISVADALSRGVQHNGSRRSGRLGVSTSLQLHSPPLSPFFGHWRFLQILSFTQAIRNRLIAVCMALQHKFWDGRDRMSRHPFGTNIVQGNHFNCKTQHCFWIKPSGRQFRTSQDHVSIALVILHVKQTL